MKELVKLVLIFVAVFTIFTALSEDFENSKKHR